MKAGAQNEIAMPLSLAEVKSIQLVIAKTFGDVPSGVHVRVFVMNAIQALELGLRATIIFMDKSARVALLTGIRGFHRAIAYAALI